MELSTKQIASDLTAVAMSGAYPQTTTDDDVVEVYSNGTFKVRCLPCVESILAVADKYHAHKGDFTNKHNKPLPRHRKIKGVKPKAIQLWTI